MPMQKTCTVLQSEALDPYGFSLLLDAGEPADEAVPGQFLHIDCGGRTLLRRPFGICAAKDGLLRIVYEVRGKGTELLTRLRPGDTLDVLGPLGHGFDLSGERILLAGGGLGVSPLLFAAEKSRKPDAVLGFRSASYMLLTEDFRSLCGRVDIATDDGSFGEHALVDSLVRRRLAAASYDRVLACGPHPMLKAVAAAAKEAGVPCQVSLEARMGCGVGACLVCACKKNNGDYAHVCKDGPVFDASEVDWDA